MRDDGFGMDFESLITTVALLLVGFSFVDDTDLIQDGKDRSEALSKSQDALDLWEQLLCATGGASDANPIVAL